MTPAASSPFVLVLLAALCCVPSSSLRAVDLQLGDVVAEPDSAITIVLTVQDKRQVMDHFFSSWFGGIVDWGLSNQAFMGKIAEKFSTILPEKLAEAGITAAVSTNGIHDLSLNESIVIQDLDLRKVLTKSRRTDGEAFADALLSLEPILGRLGAGEKFEGIKAKIAKRAYGQLVRVLPGLLKQRLGEMGVDVTVDVYPGEQEFDEDELLPAPLPAVRELIYWINIEDRTVVASAAGGGIKAFAARHMSNPKFLKLIRDKLEEVAPKAVQEKIGSALHLTFQTEDDFDAGSAKQRTGFWLLVSMDDVDISQLLTIAKGKEFADAFADLVATLTHLHELGVEQMGAVLQRIQSGIDQKVLGNVREKVAEAITEKIGGSSFTVERDEYDAIRKFTSEWPGRCCSVPESPGSSNFAKTFWVSESLLKRANLFASAGRCPYLNVRETCASGSNLGGRVVNTGLTQSFFESSIHCFPHNFLEFGLNVPIVLQHC